MRNNDYKVSASQGLPETPAYFLQLTRSDNDSNCFWQDFARTLSRWNSAFVQEKMNTPIHLDEGEFLAAFLEAARKMPLVLFVFGYGYIENPVVKLILERLLEVKEPYFRILILMGATNAVDYSPLPKMMSIEEEAVYYIEHGIYLSAGQMEAVRMHTDGWLGLVEDVAWLLGRGRHLDSVIEALDQNLFHFMEAKYYMLYTPEEKQALLYLSFLDSFSLEMARDLTGIEMVSFKALLVENPSCLYEAGAGMFYFHNVYRRFLENMRGLLPEDAQTAFFGKTAYWYFTHGNRERSLQYFSKAGNHEKVLEILCAMKHSDFNMDQFRVHLDVIHEMPRPFMEKHPEFVVVFCHIQNKLFNYEETDRIMKMHIAELEKWPQNDHIRHVLGESYLLWAQALRMFDRSKSTDKLRRAAALLPNGSSLWDKRAQFYSNNLTVNLDAPEKGQLWKNLSWIQEYAPLVYNGAIPDLWRGIEDLTLAESNYMTMRLDDVELPASRAVKKALIGEQYDIACSALFLLMRYHIYFRNMPKVSYYRNAILELAKDAPYQTFFPLPDVANASYHLVNGQPEEMAGWLKDGHYPGYVPQAKLGLHWTHRTHYLMFVGRYIDAVAYLENGMELCKAHKRNLLGLCFATLLASAQFLIDLKEEAVQTLIYVYTWSHPDEVYMPIIEVAAYIKPLFEYCVYKPNAQLPEMWVAKMLEKVNAVYDKTKSALPSTVMPRESVTGTVDLLNRLTGREAEILRMLTTDLSRAEIAKAMGLGEDTLRGACARLYRKLNVRSREEVVALAKRLLP